MHNFLKKEFLLGLGTGFIISALIISLFGMDVSSDKEFKETNQVSATGGHTKSTQNSTEISNAGKKSDEKAEITTETGLKNGAISEANIGAKNEANVEANIGVKTEVKAQTATETKVEDKAEKLQNNKPAVTPHYVNVVVKSGMTSEKICSILEENGIIKDQNAFYKLITAHNAHAKFKVGTFKLPAGGNMEEILRIMTGQN